MRWKSDNLRFEGTKVQRFEGLKGLKGLKDFWYVPPRTRFAPLTGKGNIKTSALDRDCLVRSETDRFRVIGH